MLPEVYGGESYRGPFREKRARTERTQRRIVLYLVPRICANDTQHRVDSAVCLVRAGLQDEHVEPVRGVVLQGRSLSSSGGGMF